MKSYVCGDALHSGDRLIPDARDAYEIRLESRRLVDQRGRKNVQLVSVICKECLPFRLDEMAGRLPRQWQGSLLG
jgi:hypothetical protein